MGARLVQLDAGHPVAIHELSEGPLVIGREPSCDIVVEHGGVSRRHALVEWWGDRGLLKDLGSSNGTSLNGRPLSGATELFAGDTFDLGGEVSFLVEPTAPVREARNGVRLLVAALLLVALAGGAAIARELFYWRLAPYWNGTLGQAKQIAAEGVKEFDESKPRDAKQALQRAYWLLYTHGYLDDVPRRDAWAIALERLRLGLGTDRDLSEIFKEAIREPDVPPSEGPGCRLDRVDAPQLRPCLIRQIQAYARALRQNDQQIPGWFVDAVGRTLRSEHDRIARALARGKPLIPRMEAILQQAKMPPLLHYLACAESGYQNEIGSSKQAVGCWQFIRETAARYGLIKGKEDDRTDCIKSTRAAAEYLRDLALEFGGDSLMLAMAGYNRGENGVRQSLRQLDDPFTDRNYFTLVERNLLPPETREYVPRIFAQAVAGEGGLPDEGVLAEAGF